MAWITGASGGIGSELCLQLADRDVAVAATSRSKDRLHALAKQSEKISVFPADVTEPATMHAIADDIEAGSGPVDLAILAAGVLKPHSPRQFDPEIYRRTCEVNYLGVVNGIAAVLPRMIRRKHGHIVILGSVVSQFGIPEVSAYGASKAALVNLAQSLKLEVESHGIAVTLVNLGTVKTPMIDELERCLPYAMSPRKAARRILDGLEQRQFEIAILRRVTTAFKIIRCLPERLAFRIVRAIIAQKDT